MIDFEQEIETRLAHFQHLTGKGNVKDGNRILYEIVRLMLGMINQNNGGHPEQRIAPHADTVVETEPADDHVAPPNPTLDEVAPITPIHLGLSKPAKTWGEYRPADDEAPFGYTRSGYARTSMPANGLTEGGLPRKSPLRQPPAITTTTTEENS